MRKDANIARFNTKTLRQTANPDAISYLNSDSGCEVATKFLDGKQSCCLECPFEECYYVSTKVGRPGKA